VGQNIYDDPDFDAAYRQLPRSEHALAGAPEWLDFLVLAADR
jgi:hypothetical protein